MKLCSKHESALRQALKSKGLGDMIAADVDEVFDKMKGLAKEGLSLQTFDAFIHAHSLIVMNSMGWLSLHGTNPMNLLMAEDGEFKCPICFINEIYEEHDQECDDPEYAEVKGQRVDDWIEKAACGTLEHCNELQTKATGSPG